jgi:hypothetical protein
MFMFVFLLFASAIISFVLQVDDDDIDISDDGDYAPQARVRPDVKPTTPIPRGKNDTASILSKVAALQKNSKDKMAGVSKSTDKKLSKKAEPESWEAEFEVEEEESPPVKAAPARAKAASKKPEPLDDEGSIDIEVSEEEPAPKKHVFTSNKAHISPKKSSQSPAPKTAKAAAPVAKAPQTQKVLHDDSGSISIEVSEDDKPQAPAPKSSAPSKVSAANAHAKAAFAVSKPTPAQPVKPVPVQARPQVKDELPDDEVDADGISEESFLESPRSKLAKQAPASSLQVASQVPKPAFMQPKASVEYSDDFTSSLAPVKDAKLVQAPAVPAYTPDAGPVSEMPRIPLPNVGATTAPAPRGSEPRDSHKRRKRDRRRRSSTSSSSSSSSTASSANERRRSHKHRTHRGHRRDAHVCCHHPGCPSRGVASVSEVKAAGAEPGAAVRVIMRDASCQTTYMPGLMNGARFGPGAGNGPSGRLFDVSPHNPLFYPQHPQSPMSYPGYGYEAPSGFGYEQGYRQSPAPTPGVGTPKHQPGISSTPKRPPEDRRRSADAMVGPEEEKGVGGVDMEAAEPSLREAWGEG